MKKFYLFLIFLLSFNVFGQNGQVLPKTYNHGFDGITAITKDNQGRTYVVGYHTQATQDSYDIVRLDVDGIPDPGFMFDDAYFPFLSAHAPSINCLYFDNDTQSLYVGGYIYNEITNVFTSIFKVDSFGIVDTNFNENIPAGLNIHVIAKHPVSGQILVGGHANNNYAVGGVRPFYSLNNNTGKLNTTFNQQTSFASGSTTQVRDIKFDSSGNIIVGGRFRTNNATSTRALARLYPTGALDTSFAPTITGTVYAIEFDGTKIIVGGDGSGSGSLLRRFNNSGTADTSFTFTTSGKHVINEIIRLCDGKFIVGGTGVDQPSGWNCKLLRLENSGVIDSNFISHQYTQITGHEIFQVLKYDNEDLCIAGFFSAIGSNSRSYIADLSNMQTVNAENDIVTIMTGTTSSASVLVNDLVNGQIPTLPYTVLTQLSTTNANVNLNNSGNIVVAPGTPAGTYTIEYKICLGTTNCYCDNASVSITVTPTNNIINAENDNTSVPVGYLVPPISYLSNDTLGTNTASESTVISTWIDNPYGFSFSSGMVSVPLLPQGTYTVTYQICETANPTNCDTATITLKIGSTGPIIDPFGPEIILNNDNTDTIINCQTIIAVNDVLANDTLKSGRTHTPATTSNVTLSLVSSSDSGITLNTSTGQVSVSDTVPSGSHTLVYQVCLISNPTQCATATVTIVVEGCANTVRGANHVIFDSVLEPDGDIIIVGNFTLYNGIQRNRIARLKPDLSLDLTFDPNGIGFNDVIYSVALDQNSNIVVGGRFTSTTTGTIAQKIARINPNNGEIDTTFYTQNVFQNSTSVNIRSVKILPDGSIIAGGDFNSVNSTLNTKGIAKFSSNGILDNITFTSPLSAISGIRDLYITQSGDIIFGGKFLVHSTNCMLAKISNTGVIDPSFIRGNPGNQNGVFKIESTSDNKLIIVGDFEGYDSTTTSKDIAKIDLNGNVEPLSSFNPGNSSNSSIGIESVAVDSSGRILIGGDFTSFNGNVSNGIARLTSAGSFDGTFNTGTGFSAPYANKRIFTIKVQPDNKIIVGGFFTQFNGNTANYITRLIPTNPVILGRGINPVIQMDQIPEVTNYSYSNNFSLTIYPNPSTGLFNLDLSGFENEKFDLVIHNPLGQMIYQGSITAETVNQIDLTNYQAGNYFVRLQNNTRTINKIITKK